MKKAEIKDRIAKVDDRFLILVQKYPVLSFVVIMVSLCIGMIIGKVFV